MPFAPSPLVRASVLACVLLTLSGCGTQADGTGEPSFGPKPKVKATEIPLPKKLVVEDIRMGSGETVEPGDEIELRFVNVNLETRSRYESDWRGGGVSWRLGESGLSEGFKRGILGMRVGGRREIVIPSNLAYGTGPIVYVLDLLAVR